MSFRIQPRGHFSVNGTKNSHKYPEQTHKPINPKKSGNPENFQNPQKTLKTLKTLKALEKLGKNNSLKKSLKNNPLPTCFLCIPPGCAEVPRSDARVDRVSNPVAAWVRPSCPLLAPLYDGIHSEKYGSLGGEVPEEGGW